MSASTNGSEAKRGFHLNNKRVEKVTRGWFKIKKSEILKEQHTALEAYLSYRKVIF